MTARTSPRIVGHPWGKKGRVLLRAIALVTFIGICSASQAQWLTGWDYRKEIVLDGAEIADTHTNFPVLIHLTDSDLQADALANGHDIVFTDNTATTELEHELESYNSGTGELVAWVKMDLTASTDETIYMYYGNSSASDPDGDDEDTWDSNYMVVYHMNDALDATTNNRDATLPGGSNSPATVAGRIGDARDFDGVDDYYDTQYSDLIDHWTVSAWVYADAAPGSSDDAGIIMREENYNLGWDHGSGSFRGSVFFRHTGDSWSSAQYGAMSGSTWYYLVGTYENDELKAYVDGQLITPFTTLSPTGDSDNAPETAKIARHADRSEFWGGLIDEARISNVARSANWIETEFNNQSDPGVGGFIKTLGSEELACSIAAGTITGDASLFDGESTTLTIAGYDGGATLQWQSSSDNSSWSDIGGQTGTTLNTGALGSDTYYRVAVTNTCTNYSPSFLVEVEPAFLSGYLFRKKLTLDGSKFTSTQSNFPVPIALIDEDLANHALCSGWDIVFTDESGSTLYEHDLDEFNKDTGDLTAWINMNVTASTDEEIYMYFGNESATDPGLDSDLTWDSNFVGVWHLGESADGTAGEFADDSGNGNDGRGGNGTSTRVPMQVEGQIGNAQYFDGSDDLINCGSDASLDNLPSFTASAWIRPEASATSRRIFEKRATSAEAKNWYLDGASAELRFVHKGGTEFSRRGNAVTLDTWQHVAMTWTGGMTSADVDFYINGVLANAGGSDGATPVDDAGGDFWIGNRHDAARAFIGIIDELRMSSTVRSADWLALEYSLLSDPQAVIQTVAASETSCDLTNGYVNPETVTIDSGDDTNILVFNYEPGATIQWQSSTDGCTWSDVSGATSSTLSTGALTQSTQFRVAVTNGCTVFSGLSDVTVLPTYAGQKKITISSDDVYGSSDLTNFPLLVSMTDNDLRTTANGGSVENSNGYDMIFEDADGNVLNHEIISYDASTGAYQAWVQVPTLQYNEDTDIFLSYGATGITDDPSTNGTWNSDYLGVWHLDDGTDATSNSNDLTTQGDAAATAGLVGNAYVFDGTGDYLEDADASSYLTGLNNLTIQAWVNADVAAVNDGFINFNQTELNDGATGIRFDAAGLEGGGTNVIKATVTTDATNSNYETTTGDATADWTHIVATWTAGNDLKVYVDGVETTISGTRNAPATGTTDVNDALRIGWHAEGEWDGLIDEVRILSSELSSGWIQTEYFNQDDPANFITVVDNCGVDAGTLTATNASVDVNDETTLFVNDYQGGASLQWQISTNGTDFTDIAGSTTDTLNTGALTASRYYRVEATGTCVSYSDPLQISVDGAHFAGYDYRKKITLTGSEIAGTHGDFPVLVRLDSDTDLAANVTNANGYDIIFTEADGITQVPHQIEKYDNGTGQLVAWVKTDLTASTDKEMYMYYGNSAVSAATEDVANTWNSNYQAVFHFNADATDAIGTASSPSESNTNYVDGIMGGAVDLEENNSANVDTNENFGASITSNLTLSSWVNIESASNDGAIIGEFFAADPVYQGFLLWMDDGTDGFAFGVSPSTTLERVGEDYAVPSLVGTWHHAVGTWDGSTIRLYVDGAEVRSASVSGTLTNGAVDASFGSNSGGNTTRLMDGMIDEGRILGATLDANWILTEYNNQRIGSTFLTLGSQEWNCGISPTGTVSSSVATVLSGETASVQLSAYQLGNTLQWQSSSDGVTFADIGGATAASHTTAAISADTYYRVELNDGTCDAYSDTLLIALDYSFVDGYSYRKKLTVPAANVSGSGDLTNFPLLVDITDDSLRSEANGGHVYNDNGYEIKFTSLAGSDLSYERETYDPATGNLRAWVNIPTLSGSEDTEFYLYYGNCTTLADPSSAAAWNSDFTGVYHMDDGGDQSDSKGVYNLTNDGTTSEAGQIGDSRDFEANDDDHLDFANDIDIVRNASTISMSCWMRPESVNGSYMVAALSIDDGASTSTSRVSLEFGSGGTPGRMRYGGRAGDGESFRVAVEGTASITSTGNWHHVVGVLDYANDEIRIYIDGSLEASNVSANFTATSASNTHSTNGAVGAEDNGTGTRHFDGRIDELHISTAELTADWIKTEYDNQLNASSFVTAAEEETEFQWTGATSTAWETSTNWSSCELPTAGIPIRIPDVTNDPVLSGSVSMGDLAVDAGGVLSFGSADVTITGDIDNGGTIDGGTSTVNFTGTADQAISGNSVTLNDLVLDKASGEVQVFDELIVDGTLTLTQGFITLTGGDLSITEGTLAGGGPSAFVITPGGNCLRLKVENSPTLFAVGADTDSYTPAILDNSGVADTFCIRVIDNVFADGSESGAEFSEGAVGRTWFIDEELAGGSDVQLTLQWRNADQKNGFAPGNARITHFNSGLGDWEAKTSSSVTDLGNGRYSLAASNITDFSPFSVGSTVATLPVELIAFAAERAGSRVIVTWSTASEIDNDFFSVERGADDDKFEVIATTPGQGTSDERTDYQHIDERPLPGNSYYRLKQTDFDGAYSYSQVILVQDGVARTPEMSIFPNANNGVDFTWSLNGLIPNSKIAIVLLDVNGRTLQSQEIQVDGNGVYQGKGFENLILEAGVYLLKVRNGDTDMVSRLMVR